MQPWAPWSFFMGKYGRSTFGSVHSDRNEPETEGEDRTQEAWAAQATEQKRRRSRKYDRWIIAAASLGLSGAAAYLGIERYLETLPQLHFGRW
jgi:hypothetical protein